MACTGHNGTICPAHANCASHGVVARVSPVAWAVASPLKSKVMTATIFNELRGAIRDELARRSKSPMAQADVKLGDKSFSTEIRNLRNAINTCKTWTYPTDMTDVNTAVGSTITTQIDTMRAQINTYKQEDYCACNCNYACTCQCNYACTCDCNYCTCNCNYCTCNCNYSCTCNCNYLLSDARMKKEITYL